MRFWVGVTDKEWFEHLREQVPDEVNFWQPSSRRLAEFLEPGVPFLFKLHAPDNFVVGGGFFVRFSALPARLAWEAFGEKNGVTDYSALRKRIEQYRGVTKGDPEIGCNVLNAPFFLEKRDWIPVPESWASNIVRGRTFDTEATDGLQLWNAVSDRMRGRVAAAETIEQATRYGAEYLARARLGQGAFRVLVTEAYERRCAITGERTLPVLEAAHIKPYAEEGPHLISNGLLLRSDLHILFDDGYITVTEDFKVEVSKRIEEEFHNGKEYYRHRGKPLVVVPGTMNERPSAEFLRWHNEKKFVGG
jgi:putative restriction endonuclease